MFLKRCLEARSGDWWLLGGMVAQSNKIRYQWMGGSSMGWDFRQWMGGQSFFQVQDRWVGCAIEGWDIFRGGRFQAMDSVNYSVFHMA